MEQFYTAPTRLLQSFVQRALLALLALLALGRSAFRLSNVELRAQVEGTSPFAQPRRDRG
jgi:hypothetical protein